MMRFNRRIIKGGKVLTVSQHYDCVNGDNCHGPGCTIRTGKTVQDRSPVQNRQRFQKWQAQFNA